MILSFREFLRFELAHIRKAQAPSKYKTRFVLFSEVFGQTYCYIITDWFLREAGRRPPFNSTNKVKTFLDIEWKDAFQPFIKEDSLGTRHRGAPAQSSSQNKRTFRNDCLTRIVRASEDAISCALVPLYTIDANYTLYTFHCIFLS